ncbi:hypothetical protein O181_115924 [Austropuccinia psidii MF-1]|uniref:Uncharacterized protein n=1 Tax=Austropuccinia psidii MF-1 TaxID=1389203 RepID=A0A9Q3K7X0_9BASI|nr:hypothetical protein [Austropuccinia psidii MF-1]
MRNNIFNLASHWEDLGESFPKIFLKDIPFKELMVITKGWNPNTKLKLMEERKARIRENQAIEEQLNQKEHNPTPSRAQGVSQPDSPVASNHSSINRSVANSNHYSHCQVASRRKQ